MDLDRSLGGRSLGGRRFPGESGAILCFLVLAGCSSAAPAPREDRAVQILQQMIEFDTINPPQPDSKKPNADETALCRWIQSLLAKAGISSEIYESAPGRGNLVARIKGTGAKKPLLLMAHLDVVNVDPKMWDVPPLKGEIRDGVLYGRGALDDKGWAAVAIEVMMRLAAEKAKPSRDIILMLNADEESAGSFGAEWMVKNHWDQIECELVLNEGGRVVLDKDGKVTQVHVQPAEKVYNDFRLWIPGASGHSSVPRTPNAIFEISKMLARLESFETPIEVTPVVAGYFEAVASLTPEFRDLMLATAKGDLEAAAKLAKAKPEYNAILRTTVVPTVVKGGIRVNVLPPAVEVNFNARLLPGKKLGDLIDAMSKLLGLDAKVLRAGEFDPARTAGPVWIIDTEDIDAPASPVESEVLRAARVVSKDLLVVPVLLTGATDSRFFRARGVAAYGIHPCPTSDEERLSVHNHNERVRVSSVTWGVTWLQELVNEISK